MHDLPLLTAIAAYDLEPPITTFAVTQGKNNTSVGIHTGAGDFIWRGYAAIHGKASIHYEHRLLAWLATAGLSFAIPVPVPARDGSLLVEGSDGRGMLSRYVRGSRVEPGDPEQAELLGRAIGELHTTLQRYASAPRPGRPLFESFFEFPEEHDPRTLTPTSLGLPEQPPYVDQLAWWRSEASELDAFVKGVYRTLPWQVCHNDVTPANVLVDGGRVSAVLDWEFATVTARAQDIAMGLRMTMQVWENPEPWPIVRRLLRGYARYATLTEAEAVALPLLLRLRSTIGLLWWLAHLPRTSSALEPVVRGIQYQRNLVDWLASHGERFVEVVLEELST